MKMSKPLYLQIIALNESSDQVREYRHYREDLESLSYVADTILDISTSTVEYLVSKSNIKVPFLHSKLGKLVHWILLDFEQNMNSGGC